MLPDLVVSDFAGTAMREEGAVLVAYRQALSACDIPFTEEDLAARRGANKRAVFHELAARAYPAERAGPMAEAALGRFEAALRQEYSTGDVREVDGAEAAFRRLRSAGVKLALTSGFDRAIMRMLLGRLGWESLFDCTLAGDSVPAGRPAPYLIYRAMMETGVIDVGRVAVVGDTALDLEAGANARVGWIVGVLSGAHGIDTLGLARHTHILPSVRALPELFGLRE